MHRTSSSSLSTPTVLQQSLPTGKTPSWLALVLHLIALTVVASGAYCGITGGFDTQHFFTMVTSGATALAIGGGLYYVYRSQKGVKIASVLIVMAVATAAFVIIGHRQSLSIVKPPAEFFIREGKTITMMSGSATALFWVIDLIQRRKKLETKDSVALYSGTMFTSRIEIKGLNPDNTGHVFIWDATTMLRVESLKQDGQNFLLTQDWPQGRPLPGYQGARKLVVVYNNGIETAPRFTDNGEVYEEEAPTFIPTPTNPAQVQLKSGLYIKNGDGTDFLLKGLWPIGHTLPGYVGGEAVVFIIDPATQRRAWSRGRYAKTGLFVDIVESAQNCSV